MAYSDYEPVIGLEIHVQMKTKSKMFCSCSTSFGDGDNENTCPVCAGMPGALPVINSKAVEYGVKTGMGLQSEIVDGSTFSRKNYFYPDMPKGYQITQYDLPVCRGGAVEFFLDGEKKVVELERAHLEEDAGKSTHHGDHSLINLNRAGTPLLEIVTKPTIKSPEEAAEYARTVRRIVRYLDVCDGNLEEGSLRCDCNVSVRKKGETKLGTKVEIKNINSFRFVEKSLHHEIERQIDCIESGEEIVQETRLYDADKNRTFSMRTKEDAHDYRYFPEPDLVPVMLDEAVVKKWREELPELPTDKIVRFQKEFNLPEQDCYLLTQEKSLANYFEESAKISGNAKLSANWIITELNRKLNEEGLDIEASKVSARQMGELVGLINENKISGKIAKSVFAKVWESGDSPKEIVEKEGLGQISDTSEIERFVDQVIEKNPDQAQEFREGKDKILGFFVGQVMKLSRGQASPEMVNKLIFKKLRGQ